MKIGDQVRFRNSGSVRYGIITDIRPDTQHIVIIETDKNWQPTMYVWTLLPTNLESTKNKTEHEKAYARAMSIV